jgi:hypothetical protein
MRKEYKLMDGKKSQFEHWLSYIQSENIKQIEQNLSRERGYSTNKFITISDDRKNKDKRAARPSINPVCFAID